MAEQDSLSAFDFNKVSKPSKFLKWQAGKPLTIRVLTKDPVIQERQFQDKKTGEINFSTKFCFIVWNFTDGLAQILSAGPSMAKTFQRIANDPDFGSDLQKCDIKISPEGEMLERVYDINVLRHSGSEEPLTKAMIDEAKEIDLDKDVSDSRGRLSTWEPQGVKTKAKTPAPKDEADQTPEKDVEIEDIDDEAPIDLSDIPF